MMEEEGSGIWTESVGERKSLFSFFFSVKGLQRMFLSFVITGVLKRLGTCEGKRVYVVIGGRIKMTL